MRFVLFLSISVIILTVAPLSKVYAFPFKDGATILFMGHSYFMPGSQAYNEIATHPRNRSQFPNHSFLYQTGGGAKGAPGAFWEDSGKKQQIIKKLQTGKVEVLAMTLYKGEGRSNPYENSEYIDLARWIDTALQYNPNTEFLISAPWPKGGPKMSGSVFDRENEADGDIGFDIVSKLRKDYRNVNIHYLNHGRVAAIAKLRFEARRLKSVQGECCGDNHLFEDSFGHGGDIIDKTVGALFIHYLTGRDISQLVTIYNNLESREVVEIVDEAIVYNQRKGYLLGGGGRSGAGSKPPSPQPSAPSPQPGKPKVEKQPNVKINYKSLLKSNFAREVLKAKGVSKQEAKRILEEKGIAPEAVKVILNERDAEAAARLLER